MPGVTAVAIEDVRAGDEIVLSHLGTLCVSAVHVYDEDDPPTYVLCYFKHGETTYENKARDKSGMNERGNHLTEKSLRPLHAGDEVDIIRGNPARADELRALMERQLADRSAAAAERWRRASVADERRKEGDSNHVDPPRDESIPARSFMCVCGHRILSDTHVLRRENAPGTPYRWGHCLVDGCTCPQAHPETDGPRS